MKVLILIFSFVLTFEVSATPFRERESFHDSIIGIGAANSSKQWCSCLYVMKMPKEFCERFTQIDKIVDFFDITSVYNETKSIGTWLIHQNRKAYHMSEKLGCTLK